MAENHILCKYTSMLLSSHECFMCMVHCLLFVCLFLSLISIRIFNALIVVDNQVDVDCLRVLGVSILLRALGTGS